MPATVEQPAGTARPSSSSAKPEGRAVGEVTIRPDEAAEIGAALLLAARALQRAGLRADRVLEVARRCGQATTRTDLLTVGEVAKLTDRSERTVRRWISTGRLPTVQVGAVRMVPRAAIDGQHRSPTDR